MTVRTGRVVNIVLGSGDSSKFDLLGGTFGEGGDYSAGRDPGSRRFLKNESAAAILRAAGGGPVGLADPNAFPPGVRPRPNPGPRDSVK